MARLFDDAAEEYLTVASAVVTAAPLTMACWFNTNDLAVNQHLVTITLATGWHFFSLMAGAGSLSDHVAAYAGDAGSSWAETTSAFSVNTWHHACAVFSAANARAAYLDGGGKGTDSTSITPAGLDTTTIGVARLNSKGYAYTSGMVAGPAIWNVALTDAEVAMLALGVSPLLVRPANLVSHWDLIRGIQDRVGGYHLTASGTTVANHCPKVRPWWFRPLIPHLVTVGGVQVTPGAAAAIAALIDPSVLLGSTSVAPGTANGLASGINPLVVLGSITFTPGTATALAACLDPAVLVGNVVVQPGSAEALALALLGAVVLGSTTMVPGNAAALAALVDPSVVLGSVALAPGVAAAISQALLGLVIHGSMTVTPGVAQALASLTDPTVVVGGNIFITPDAAIALALALDPTVIGGGELARKLRALNLFWNFGTGLRR